jgi:phosphatidate cytidylyltransferase
MAVEAFRRPEVRDGFLAWLGGSFGALYPSLLAFVAAILVVAPEVPGDAFLGSYLDAGRTWLLVLVLTVWSFDTFAYLSGRTFKRGRFLNHISPNKTWSGVIGGTVAAVIVAGLLTFAAGQWLPGGLLLGLSVAVAGQAGDVAESMLKRSAGAKDSGSLIPGHGGILDRVDSFLFAAPVVFGYLLVVGG